MIEIPRDGKVLLYGPEMIHVESDPIYRDEIGDVPALREYMVSVMRRHKGVGLAAPQVGVFKQFVILQNENGSIIDLINPNIDTMYGREFPSREGCLSVPPSGNHCFVPRMETVVVSHDTFTIERCRQDQVLVGVSSQTTMFKGQAAAIVQHEIDHLTGTFFFDRVCMRDRKEVLDRFEIWKKEKRHVKSNPRQLTAAV